MNTQLHPVMAAALAPFAPPQSVVHQIVRDDEGARIAQDIAHDAEKNSGALDRANERRAFELQMSYQDATGSVL